MPSLQSYPLRFLTRRINAFGDASTTLQQLRQRGDRSMERMKPPSKVTIQAAQAGSIPLEWVIPTGAADKQAVLYFHGGAFVMGSITTHRNMLCHLALACQTRILSVDYRLAPEHPFPAALDDCLAAYHWLLERDFRPGDIVLGGDSAGGNLALALLLQLRDVGQPLPAAAACLSPVTDLEGTRQSRRTRAPADPILGKGFGSINIPICYSGQNDLKHPYLSPLFADLQGLPPILLHVGEDEILFDDSVEFVEKARKAGVDAQVVIWPHMWHVFQMFAPMLPEANRSLAQVGEFIRTQLRTG
jgi:acetyl esterase/lipase